MGGRVIVTTRTETVANACIRPDSASGHNIYKMQPLKLEDSKKLFLSRVFGSVDASYPMEFEVVMGDILKKCGGLPLAIVSIASVLVGYKSSESKDKWVIVCKSIGSQMERHPTLEGMKHIVTLSYNHLPHELKCCMMYFSIFPEDYVIEKDRLLNRWMAEGLVHQKRGLTMWEVAESYLDELLSRNMIEEVNQSEVLIGHYKSYKVHDMLLEVMVSKSLESNFLSLDGGQNKGILYDKIRRLSIHADVESTDFIAKRNNVEGRRCEDNFNMQHVRSLSMFQLHGKHKLLKNLCNFVLLRVLDLQECEGVTNKHVRYVCNLYLLQFLSLRGTDVSKVPRQIGNLEHLQTLNLGETLLTELPETITKLEKLEYMEFSNRESFLEMWTMPRGINRMKMLRVMGRVRLGFDPKVFQEVGELEQLQDLDLSIDSSKTIAEGVLKELALSISKLHSLRSLSIGIYGLSEGGTILNFLHHLPTPPRLLQTLCISGCIFNGLSSWIGSLTHLVSFSVEDTTLIDDELFGVTCKLPNLKTFYVAWDCCDELVARHKFPVLRNLMLGGYLPKIIQFEAESLAMLEMLELSFDARSRHVDDERSIVGIEHLTNLKKVAVNSNGNTRELVQAVLEQLKAENDRPSSRSIPFQISVKYY